tara:strand:- start:5511 stop:6260 length:750 start_codon:yes stop_codon:yes gene_type:complete
MDLVTVIIPYYKQKKYIAKTIDSVITQTYKNLEIIVIYDNGSDSELDYIKSLKIKDKRIKLIVNKKNIGAGESRNKAIKSAKGKFISFLDSDDLWKKNKLKKQLKIMKKYNYDITHTSYEIIEKNNKIIGHRTARTFKNVNSLIRSCDIGLSTVMIKKSILKKSDSFAKIKTKEDFVFWLKLLDRKIKIYGIKIFLTKWRKLNNSLSSSILQKLKDGFTVYNKYLKMGFIKSMYYLFLLSINSIIKKIN